MGAARALPEAVGNIHTGALTIGTVTLAVGFLWPRRFSRFAPGPLVALVAGTALGVLAFGSAPVIGAIPTGLPTPAVQASAGRIPAARAAAGDHPCAAWLGRQPVDVPGGRFDDWRSPQPGPGIDRSGHRQHGRRADRRVARCRRDHGHRHQHPVRRNDAGVGSVTRVAPAGSRSRPWKVCRADPARGAGRGADQGRVGHRRLAHAGTGFIASGASTCS